MPVIALINESSLDDADVAFMAAAVDMQLREDLVPRWAGVDYTPLTFFASTYDLPSASGIARLMIIKDTIDEAGAAGYHDFVGVPRSIILAQGEQTSVTISHEALEMSVDPTADRWVKMSDGREVALEICDPCEATTYAKKVAILSQEREVAVSSFVGPEWFQPGPDGFKLSAGGYMIVIDGAGRTIDVWADANPKRRRAKVDNPTSRFNARGVR